MKRLIFNADDYGRSPDISRGVREAYGQGVVRSTTCMMHIRTTAADIAAALKETPGLQMGVHLVLTMGKPLGPREETKSITDENGNFFKYNPFIEHLPTLDMEEVKAEWRRQIEAFIKASGREPTHLDSHHHSSYFSPKLFRTMLELAKEYQCAIRYPFTGNVERELLETGPYAADLIKEFNPRRPDHLVLDFYNTGATQENLLKIIDHLGDFSTEIMCHPGHVDSAFVNESVYNLQREREFNIVTDPIIKKAVQANGIELISFAEL